MSKHEGFIRRAMQSASQADARWIANQALFNGADDEPVNQDAKAAVIWAIAVFDQTELKDHDIKTELYEQVHGAETKGQLRAVVETASALLPN